MHSLHQHQVESMLVPSHNDNYTLSHFHLACLKERVSVVKELIDGGADLNETITWDAPGCHYYSPLHCAVESPYDRKEKVQLLLQHGAVVKQGKCICKRKHMTALHLAFYDEYCMNNKDLDSTIVDSLYRAVKDKEENIEDGNKLGYFHIAVSRNDFDMVKMYLDKGANINQLVLPNHRGYSQYTPLCMAVKYELIDMAKFLMECGACVDVDQDNKHHTPLLKAVQTGNLEMVKLLSQSGATIQNFLLIDAVVAGNSEVVQLLVDLGCNVNVQDINGQTPIILSLKADSPCKKIIEILLEAEASINFEDNFGNSAIVILDTNAFLNKDVEKFEIYKMFLENTFGDEELNFSNLWLLTSGNENDIEMLLQTNVDLSVRDFRLSTLIHALARNCNPGVFEHLRGREFNVNARDWPGNTPLMDAAYHGNVNAVKSLLDLGADIEAVNADNETVLYQCLVGGYCGRRADCVQVLLEHGANAQIETLERLPTIFDVILDREIEIYSEGALVLAHLALQEMNGTMITELIQRKIDSHDRFKNYFQRCKELLLVEIHPLVTLFDVLTASQRKLEHYLKNKELASKLKDFHTTDYFHAVLNRRLSKPIRMMELREAAKPIISKLMNADYERIPSIVDDILSYFLEDDIEYLISIENGFQLDSCISDDV